MSEDWQQPIFCPSSQSLTDTTTSCFIKPNVLCASIIYVVWKLFLSIFYLVRAQN